MFIMIVIRDRMKLIGKKYIIFLIIGQFSTRFVCHRMLLDTTVSTLNKAFTPRISQNFLLYIM